MFEDYLEDASCFANQANKTSDIREAKRYYRASIFYTMGAVEAFVNYIANTLAHGPDWPEYEIAFLSDNKFDLEKGSFKIIQQAEYHRLEDKLRFLLVKFDPGFDFQGVAAWCRLLEFKELRDDITHPRSDDDTLVVVDYKKKVESGITAAIEIMSAIMNGAFGHPLRKKLIDLKF